MFLGLWILFFAFVLDWNTRHLFVIAAFRGQLLLLRTVWPRLMHVKFLRLCLLKAFIGTAQLGITFHVQTLSKKVRFNRPNQLVSVLLVLLLVNIYWSDFQSFWYNYGNWLNFIWSSLMFLFQWMPRSATSRLWSARTRRFPHQLCFIPLWLCCLCFDLQFSKIAMLAFSILKWMCHSF